MNIQTWLNSYQDYFNSFKSFYLDKQVQGQFVNEVNLLDIPCSDNTIALQLVLNGSNLNFFGNKIKATGKLPIEKKYLNQKIIYCFVEHRRRFNWRRPFDCEWVYSATWKFTNGSWVSYDNPLNVKDDSCEALFVENL
jgi:hypothetical protein